ncbi:unnamed protein product [Dovyalis caffra]|uniref:Uncharacterized protein n=1 Tax=Dovyalis caffra TaxID=77055 RepID=A0AAV1SFL5_9ROSI|nr:unnamed protein product [Dovyalis caffra]
MATTTLVVINMVVLWRSPNHLSQPTANYCHHASSAWHPDPAAASHVTRNLRNLSLAKDYKCTSKLIVDLNTRGLLLQDNAEDRIYYNTRLRMESISLKAL